MMDILKYNYDNYIIESVDSISRDERDFPWTRYITNAGISHARYTITHFKHHYHVLQLISNQMNVYNIAIISEICQHCLDSVGIRILWLRSS